MVFGKRRVLRGAAVGTAHSVDRGQGCEDEEHDDGHESAHSMDCIHAAAVSATEPAVTCSSQSDYQLSASRRIRRGARAHL